MATSFKSSPSGLVFTEPSFSGGTSNAAAYGNAVDLSKIWSNNRTGAFDPASFTATDLASEAYKQSAAYQADANAYASSLGAIGMVNQAEKQAKAIKKAAKKQARKGIMGSALGAVAGIGGTILGGPIVGLAAAQGGKALGSAIG